VALPLTLPTMPRRLLVLLTVAALAFGAGAVWLTWRDGTLPSLVPRVEQCQARVDGHLVELDVEQSRYAALITAVSVQRGMPARAATIALATAYQESDLRNLEYGDRDSLGLFQQRPSQGWGSREQLLDPYYATHAFYDALAQVDGYTALPVTEAAQRVQRSGFPDAYADHEQDARVLASALTGNSPAGFWCTVGGDSDEVSPDLDDAGLTERATAVREDLVRTFGELPLGGFAPGGVRDGHMPGSAHYDGRAIDVFVRPISVDNRRRGWAIAQYLVGQADRLGIATVIFDDRIWHAGERSQDGWQDYRVPSGSQGDRRILEHRDHVHVDVSR
jgi:hypothetical protein